MSDTIENYRVPEWDSYFMKMVYLVAEKSKDPRTKIGAVLVKDKRIIATGYNGFPMGVDDNVNRYLDRPVKYKYVVHAEANSVLSCAYAGISCKDAVLYTQGYPCNECMKSIIQGGVRAVFIHKQWPDINMKNWEESAGYSKTMVHECSLIVDYVDEILGMNGYVDGKIIRV